MCGEHGWSTGRKADRDCERRRSPTLSTHPHRDLIATSYLFAYEERQDVKETDVSSSPRDTQRTLTMKPCGCSLTLSLVDRGMALVFWSGLKTGTWPHLGEAGETDEFPAAVLL